MNELLPNFFPLLNYYYCLRFNTGIFHEFPEESAVEINKSVQLYQQQKMEPIIDKPPPSSYGPRSNTGSRVIPPVSTSSHAPPPPPLPPPASNSWTDTAITSSSSATESSPLYQATRPWAQITPEPAVEDSAASSSVPGPGASPSSLVPRRTTTNGFPPPGGNHNNMLYHAPRSYFNIDRLQPTGSKKNADVGNPYDSTLPLMKDEKQDTGVYYECGSWYCDVGGWPCPYPRTNTEIFFVWDGHGCVTDGDSRQHYFGPGDTVILPKGWQGRWDVLEPVHNLLFVVQKQSDLKENHDRMNMDRRRGKGYEPFESEFGTNSPVVRALVTHYNSLTSSSQSSQFVKSQYQQQHPESLSNTGTSTNTIYIDNNTRSSSLTKVGFWTCNAPGTFFGVPTATSTSPSWSSPSASSTGSSPTTFFHMLEGVLYLTYLNGQIEQKCVAGDTVVLPNGWDGQWEVVEPVKQLWITI